ncbi:MAG: nitrous oxide reductase accessory protein NosL [Cytophagales bacterium]|nr:nitrous oxide reductase accessory protein NosL [Cytophagales bacterium]
MQRFELKIFLTVAVNIFLWTGCNPEGKPIAYGEDKCEFCRMSIVDRRFGGEVVTNKGKIYKFDAVECTLNFLDREDVDESKIKLVLTNTYDTPGKLNNAFECYYLKSENMPSPMGMFLNPFSSAAEALNYQKANNGIVMKWDELRADFANLR